MSLSTAIAGRIAGAGLIACLAIGPVDAQQSGLLSGKTLNVLVGNQVGGTADAVARELAPYLRKHLAGNPNVVVQNMAGGGGLIVFNYLGEKAPTDGLTIACSTYQGLSQALGDKSLRVRFEGFELLGGLSETRVNYARADVVPGGLRQPADILKADSLVVGAYSNTDTAGMLSKLSLGVLGIKHKVVTGYRGGADIFLAIQRKEIQFHNTSLSMFRTRTAAFIRSGEGVGVYYLKAAGPDGRAERHAGITEMPSFADLHQQVQGRPPTGTSWEALNWLTGQTSGLAYAALAPPGVPEPVLAELRRGFESAARDPDYIKAVTATNGAPHPFVTVEEGRAIIRSIGSVSPAVLGAIKATIEAP